MAKRDRAKFAPQPRPRALQPPAPALREHRFHWLAGAALIVVMTCVAYYPALHGGFVFDDETNLANNPLVQAPDGLYRFWFSTQAYDYWPVTNSTLWVEWRLWGTNPTGYHVTNLILHIAEALLIWRILRKLAIPAAFLAALFFAVHPVNVETVAWISQRKNLMAMLFFLLSILWYLQAEMQSPQASPHSASPSNRWYGLSLAAFVLAMLSKGSVAPLPALLLVILWWLRPLNRRDLLRTAPFFLVALVLTCVNVWFQTHGGESQVRTAGLAERLLGAGGVVWFYLGKALLPFNLSFIYPQWHVHAGQLLWWLPLVLAVAVTGVLWRYRRGWSRPLLFAWMYFCVALVPVLGLTDTGFMASTLVADHYQHVALLAVVTLVAAGWGMWERQAGGPGRSVPTGAAVVVGGLLALLTWQQSGLYANGMTLYRDTLVKNPDSWLAHNNLGTILSQTGRAAEGIQHYEWALRLKYEYPEAHNNLATALLEAGRPQDAIPHFQETLRFRPDFPEAHNNLGNALRATGRLPEAIEQYEQALRVKPESVEAHDDLGLALVDIGELQEAIEQYELALRLRPDDPDTHNNLGTALSRAGHLPEAMEHLERSLQLRPNDAGTQNNMGIALAQAGELAKAIEHFQQALRLNPDLADAKYNLDMAVGTENARAPGAVEPPTSP